MSMAEASGPSEQSDLDLKKRKLHFGKEGRKRLQSPQQGVPTIYRVDPLLRELKKEHFDRSIIPLGLFDRRTSDCFDGATEKMRMQLKLDVVVTFFEDTKKNLDDWMDVSKVLVDNPTAMKDLYDGYGVSSLENDVVQSALALDAIFVTCFLSFVLVKYFSCGAPHAPEFFVGTLSKTLEFLSGESDSCVVKILQDILKLENQIPLSVIESVIKILFEVEGNKAKDILKAICWTFVQSYKWMFPCLKLSSYPKIRLQGADNLVIYSATTPATTLEVSIQGPDIARTPNTATTVGPAATNQAPRQGLLGRISKSSTDIAGLGGPQVQRDIHEPLLGQRSDIHMRGDTFSKEAGARGSGVPFWIHEPPLGERCDVHGSDADQLQTTGGYQMIEDGVEFSNCDHLLHCVAEIIWNKAENEMTEIQPTHSKFAIPWYHNFRTQRMQLPTAKELHERSIRFQGQQDFFPRFKKGTGLLSAPTIYLPQIKIDNFTEQCWQNLLAFEDVHHNYHRVPQKKSFRCYISWMRELINSKEDVAALTEGKNPMILCNGMGDPQAIVTLIASLHSKHVHIPMEHQRWSDIREVINDFYHHPLGGGITELLKGTFIKGTWIGTVASFVLIYGALVQWLMGSFTLVSPLIIILVHSVSVFLQIFILFVFLYFLGRLLHGLPNLNPFKGSYKMPCRSYRDIRYL